jgi:hypothetical protein
MLIGRNEAYPIIKILVNLGLKKAEERSSFDEIEMLLNNKNLQLVISSLIEKCQTLALELSTHDEKSVNDYVSSTIRVALEGKDKFQKDYDGIKGLIKNIDDQIGIEYEKLILEALTRFENKNKIDKVQNEEIEEFNNLQLN